MNIQSDEVYAYDLFIQGASSRASTHSFFNPIFELKCLDRRRICNISILPNNLFKNQSIKIPNIHMEYHISIFKSFMAYTPLT